MKLLNLTLILSIFFFSCTNEKNIHNEELDHIFVQRVCSFIKSEFSFAEVEKFRIERSENFSDSLQFNHFVKVYDYVNKDEFSNIYLNHFEHYGKSKVINGIIEGYTNDKLSYDIPENLKKIRKKGYKIDSCYSIRRINAENNFFDFQIDDIFQMKVFYTSDKGTNFGSNIDCVQDEITKNNSTFVKGKVVSKSFDKKHRKYYIDFKVTEMDIAEIRYMGQDLEVGKIFTLDLVEYGEKMIDPDGRGMSK